MMIPKFLLKKIYVSGSLRETDDGIAFELYNAVGPGMLTKVNGFKFNDLEFPPEAVTLKTGDTVVEGHAISNENPASFLHHQTTTCMVRGAKLMAGLNRMTLDVVSREAGKIVVSLEDQVVLP